MAASNTVIILGSSNSNGNTRKAVNYLAEKLQCDVLDLNNFKIGYFDYDFKNRHDDFLPLMESITSRYDTLIFATPVYWYTMSAVMKTFFDRLSDLLKIRKDVGRRLRGKSMAAISCSEDDDLVAGFYMPFRESAAYLGMQYLGGYHCWVDDGRFPNAALTALDLLVRELKARSKVQG